MSKYIGITIGPIVDTLSKAKETGQLWGSSYIFSYVMKQLMSELIKNKNIEKENFILPSTYLLSEDISEEEKEKLKGIGLYPDRIIFESKEGQYKLLENAVETVLNNLADNIAKELKEDIEKVKEFIHGYIQISYIETEVEDITKVISEVNNLLDIIELQNKTLSYEKENYILKVIRNTNIKDSFLSKDSYGKRIKEFKTIQEIALGEIAGQAREIINKFKDDRNDKIYSEIDSKLNIKIKKNSKYVAVVQSDGDNVGRIIANLKSKEELQMFSKKLFEYAKEANEEINRYGGVTIYAGGDDLLFFAPVLRNQYRLLENKEEVKTIFDLLVKLDEIFKNKFSDEINKIKDQNVNAKPKDKKPLPGLSFGVSISYKNYPLKESMDTAIENLFCKAKSYKCKNKMDTIEKNAISLTVLKHSGQEFSFVTNLESTSFEKFRKMINNCSDENVVTSILDKVRRDKKVIETIAKDEKCIDNYVENVIRTEYKDLAPEYFSNLKKLINKTYIEMYKSDFEEDSKCEDYFSKLVSYLKFMTFIQEGGN